MSQNLYFQNLICLRHNIGLCTTYFKIAKSFFNVVDRTNLGLKRNKKKKFPAPGIEPGPAG